MQAKESENPDSFMILQMDYPNTGRMWTGSDTGLIPEVMASGDPLRNWRTLVVNGKKRATNHRRNRKLFI